MRTLSLLLFVFVSLNLQAQKKVEKEVAYKGQPVTV